MRNFCSWWNCCLLWWHRKCGSARRGGAGRDHMTPGLHLLLFSVHPSRVSHPWGHRVDPCPLQPPMMGGRCQYSTGQHGWVQAGHCTPSTFLFHCFMILQNMGTKRKDPCKGAGTLTSLVTGNRNIQWWWILCPVCCPYIWFTHYSFLHESHQVEQIGLPEVYEHHPMRWRSE
jgi:hypothetical protein